jgi:hypothetical protein
MALLAICFLIVGCTVSESSPEVTTTEVSVTTSTSSTIPPTTTIDAETPVEPLTREYRLLDGRIATLTTHSQLTLEAYSFFINPPDIGGERHVIVAVGDPAHVAEAETAEEEATLSDTATLWRADREGQPLFLSVDLGQWAVWLSVGNQSSPPSTDALLQLAEGLTGSTDERGVVLENLELDYHELHLSGGPDELVTLRVGTCFNEMTPSGELVEDPRWGAVIRSERRAAWCIADGEVELEVHGPKAFVDGVVANIDITVGEATPSPTTSFPPEAENIPLEIGPLAPRSGHSVIWTGSEMIVWGGWGDENGDVRFADGAAFDLESGVWRVIAESPLTPRRDHQAAWTGEEMLIVGGDGPRDGAAYDPMSDSWRPLPDTPIQTSGDPIEITSSVWTGEGLVVWHVPSDQIAAYSPETDRWSRLPSTDLGVHRGVLRWTGSDLYTFGTEPVFPDRVPLVGVRLEEDHWIPLPPAELWTETHNTPASPRLTAWTGDRFVAFTDSGSQGRTLAYSPSIDTWEEIEAIPVGGSEGFPEPLPIGGPILVFRTPAAVFDPESNTWTIVELVGGDARYAVWTGTQVLAWETTWGFGTGGEPFRVAAWRYQPPD